VGHPGREHQPGDPEAAGWQLLPGWLLERRRRADAALFTVVATSYLLGVSTRRMEKLVETQGARARLGRHGGSGDPSRITARRRRDSSGPRSAHHQGPRFDLTQITAQVSMG
jgi:hypothetical protein